MGRKGTNEPVEERLARLAGRQHGMVSHRQLKAIGLGPSGIVKRGRVGG